MLLNRLDFAVTAQASHGRDTRSVPGSITILHIDGMKAGLKPAFMLWDAR